MARIYAQFAALVFLIVGAGGFLTGDAGHIVDHHASGNFDGVALHLTYLRNVLDLALAGAFAYAGWFADDSRGRTAVLTASALLLLLAVIGFIHADDVTGTQAIATLHFPLAINVFDLIAGVLGILCALGEYAEEPVPA